MHETGLLLSIVINKQRVEYITEDAYRDARRAIVKSMDLEDLPEFLVSRRGEAVVVFGDKEQILLMLEDACVDFDAERIIDFYDDPHFLLYRRGRRTPLVRLLLQFAQYSIERFVPHIGAPRIEDEEEESLIDVKSAAKFLNVSDRTVREQVSRNQIPFKRVGKSIRFSKKALLEWINDGGEALKRRRA